MVTTNRTRIARWALAGCVALVLAAPGRAAAQSRFSGIVVFGTSLSDPGNAFALVGDQSTPPDYMLNPLLIPSAPYARGGHHFSNGATWIEQYARSIGMGGSVRPALGSDSASATNFAVGAARAWNDGVNFNLTRQVDTYLARSGAAPSTALYVIEMGSNDIRDAFAVYATGGNGAPILQQALASIALNIQKLYWAGAREFLVWAPPNVALTPALRTLGPGAGALGGALTQQFDQNLSGILAQLSALPDVHFARLDVYAILNAILAQPAAYSMTNVTTACVTPSVAPFTCQAADEFLFWDGIHPTKAGHAILAAETANVLR
jgi:phospholipase/lecithinase/hemolysin